MVYFNVDYIRLAEEYGANCIQFDYKANDVLVNSDNAGFRFYATEEVDSLTGSFDSFMSCVRSLFVYIMDRLHRKFLCLSVNLMRLLNR